MLRHAMSLLSCVIAVLCVDPLFLYLPVINQDNKCLKLDKRLMVTALCLRSVNDMIYVGIIILGYISGRHNNQESPQKIKKMSLGLYFAIDILALLPIPQVRVTFLVKNHFFFFFFFGDFFFFKFNYAMRNSIIVIYFTRTMLSCLSIRYVGFIPTPKGLWAIDVQFIIWLLSKALSLLIRA
jgi:hypothetical protein